MKLYDTMISRICQLEDNHAVCRFPYKKQAAWPENEDYECIFQKETSLTLGDNAVCGCNMICATTDPCYFHGDETVLIGPDLGTLKGNGNISRIVPFARIVLLLTEEILPEEMLPENKNQSQANCRTNQEDQNPGKTVSTDSGLKSKETVESKEIVKSTEKAFRVLQQMDFVKYHIYPKGYMVRASGQSASEQVRVSRKALAQGITFERIGNTYLNHYKENPKVLQAKVIFITAPDMDYKELKSMAKQAEDIRNSLSVIMKGIATDCGSCGIREICNEIEGLRELHFGKENTGTA